MLESIGLDPVKINFTDLPSTHLAGKNLIVIPHASAKEMTYADADRVVTAVAQGAHLVTDGESPLLGKLSLAVSQPVSVKKVIYVPEPAGEAEWSSTQSVSFLQIASTSNVKTIYATENHWPLVIVGSWGKGNYMAMGALLDPTDGRGYARFPNVLNGIVSDMGVTPAFRRSGIDVYFDLADRPYPDYESLAKQWSQSGIRTIYASAWYFDDPNFDYDALIKAAHHNGILIYPWFQWPHVSKKFWNDHPEWREQTATLVDANVDWRLLMSFQNPDCLRAALADTKAFLLAHDWDGVNIAEFYFESYAGPEAPESFTPMNPIARKEFEKKSGFDPVGLFISTSSHFWKRDKDALSSYYRYRVDVMNRLYASFISEINSVARKKKIDWPLVITTIDVLTHPELADYYNIDMKSMASLLKSNEAMLQLEDEFFDWKLGPDRYTSLGQRYKEKFPEIKFMIDVNVVYEGVDPGTRFPTLEPTGTELVQIYRAAARASSGVAFYSEHSVQPWDWPLMPYAMAADLRAVWGNAGVKVSAPFQATFSHSVANADVDGEPWGCGDEKTILLPMGEHTIQFGSASTARSNLYVSQMSGELTRCKKSEMSLEISYVSTGRCLILLSGKPTEIALDGKKAKLAIERDGERDFVFAPSGKHSIKFSNKLP